VPRNLDFDVRGPEHLQGTCIHEKGGPAITGLSESRSLLLHPFSSPPLRITGLRPVEVAGAAVPRTKLGSTHGWGSD